MTLYTRCRQRPSPYAENPPGPRIIASSFGINSYLQAGKDCGIDLRLDFSGLTFLDSAALSGLLLLQRRTTESGVQLHLDHRPAFLDRVLQVTGLHDHFAASHSDAAAGERTLAGHTSSSESSVR